MLPEDVDGENERDIDLLRGPCGPGRGMRGAGAGAASAPPMQAKSAQAARDLITLRLMRNSAVR